MRDNMIQNYMMLVIASLIMSTLLLGPTFAQDMDERSDMFAQASQLFLNGNYNGAIMIFDEILEIDPADSRIMEMKGLAYSNMRLESTLASQTQSMSLRDTTSLNKLSMLEFYKVLEINPTSILALNGMGLGFGNFGEYTEAEKYFKKSLKIEPDNKVAQNYLDSLEKLREKYSLDVFESPTKKPDFLLKLEQNTIPHWIRNNAGWWAAGKISDNDFVSGIEYLVNHKIINVNSNNSKADSSSTIPVWIRNNAGWWAAGKISDNDFVSGIAYLIENNIINVNTKIDFQLSQKELDRKAWNFERYLINIQDDIKKQNRYIENINPSEYVIIKYWKDYDKWNLGQMLNMPESFPDRKIWFDSESDRYIIEYKVYINKQPPGLPIDHVSTLKNSFSFWEKQKFNTSDGENAVAKFYVTNKKSEANVWVTWVVRSLGEGVLGHANLGKGVVEVVIGNYGCDGSFQLFDVDTVEYIMTHELGHSIGLPHTTNQNSIMYSTWSSAKAGADYEYCLLN